jgi:hypothetical protein
MAHKKREPAAVPPAVRPSENVASGDCSEINGNRVHEQRAARLIARRYALRIGVATLVAELAGIGAP